ncbi:ubiquitin-specific protease otu1 [Coemansia sp. RSA 1813]|nr:ubiquitin-specific protease otu1 [Coemansia sp. RSA 1646]KAJ1768970.1 ubiquitin-specific protease otu1 [Coemansia sp. RSA 1843]KAJ2213328.1 ubiquitin-specific protease otu1 [Coemansia sp. RSA 487]KAJ2568187.1 ubiquitin-specific protease otu1 [Coemansia sp. RSA 1813]
MLLHIEKNSETTSFSLNTDTATFGQFKDHLSQVSNIPRDMITVKLGTPPTTASYSDDTLLIHTPFYENSHVVVTARKPCANLRANSPMLPPIDDKPHCLNKQGFPSPLPLPLPLPHNEPYNQNNYHPRIAKESVGDAWAEFKDGYLVRRTVASDNSCLFTSLSMCLGYPGLSPRVLRQIVCECIREDPEWFSEAVLGMPVDQYCEWIQQPDNWGGGIEMAAISARYHVEVCSIDIKTLRIDRFGEGKYARRVVLLYSGSHYDYIAQAASIDDPREFDQTEFETGFTSNDDDALLAAALTLASKLSDRHGFVSAGQPELKCGNCGILVRGEHGAKQHAAATHHNSFAEV